jgi:hypothetical protein
MSAAIRAEIQDPTPKWPHLMVEILRNDEPWGEDIEVGQKHFSFGREKAKLVLASWSLIEEYVSSNGTDPKVDVMNKVYVHDSFFGYAAVVKRPEFVRDEKVIRKNYLEFSFGRNKWNFGLSKAEALLLFKEKIEYVADNG